MESLFSYKIFPVSEKSKWIILDYDPFNFFSLILKFYFTSYNRISLKGAPNATANMSLLGENLIQVTSAYLSFNVVNTFNFLGSMIKICPFKHPTAIYLESGETTIYLEGKSNFI